MRCRLLLPPCPAFSRGNNIVDQDRGDGGGRGKGIVVDDPRAGGGTIEKQCELLPELLGLGQGATSGKWGAAPSGDIVILALLADGVVPAVTQHGEALAGKVLVDISNPFNSTLDGLAHTEETSVAQEAAKVAPASTSVVKAFNTVFQHVLETGTPYVFLAGDNAQAKADVEKFIESLGLRPLDAGGMKMAHWLEGAGLFTVGLANNGVGNLNFSLGIAEIPA